MSFLQITRALCEHVQTPQSLWRVGKGKEISDVAYLFSNRASHPERTSFEAWPKKDLITLQQGVPKSAICIVINYVPSLKSMLGIDILVASVHFFAEGGSVLEGCNHIPMALSEVAKDLYQEFCKKNKIIVVKGSLYNCLFRV